ncbi:MAG: hypothetical protein RL637_982 [Pseudomonadota bacterium]|jgi:hypothetical protein
MKYHQAAFKASHNSEERNETISEQLTFNICNPFNCGCSGIEFDIVQDKNSWNWSVSHGGNYTDAKDKQLTHYLQQVVDWRSTKKGKDCDRVITIHFDIKNSHLSDNDFPAKFDEYIKRVPKLANSLYKPGELMGNYNDLVSGAQANGWPELDALKNKYILCISGNEEHRKRAYAGTNPKSCLCFVDQPLETDPVQYPDFTQGQRVFMNYHLYQKYYDNWFEQLQYMATQQGFITRGWVLDNQDLWIKAQTAKLNIMATDKIKDHDWAQNGDYPFKSIV